MSSSCCKRPIKSNRPNPVERKKHDVKETRQPEGKQQQHDVKKKKKKRVRIIGADANVRRKNPVGRKRHDGKQQKLNVRDEKPKPSIGSAW